ncbi:conserved hypothetical protein [Sulfolobus islandicus Y.G.57.14]|jgi:hypothetical protein|uniref:DUF2249 domain-containing protein n=5 Tax=Sulfolobaceae TaxID=118883 RepID=H2C126_9CREN|nr:MULTISPECIES: hypothetical protein [Sulfolobaceae]ACP34926.1 conserved hypothetical protein [Sulfolobus islandicus L.S.2.15]ACP45205.1 conserved hypothetical protein [Sulfolobus islandicus Y.G.57.14]ACP48990.1 conserved hypothetical protein [Sulfolobus islandicus Y.N.15.51]EHP69975.1 hypothetical protein MetMK1DRAFT_00004770 [Metallosphaera yellowstonensis MK1]PVU77187.1 hypothetical protein DDW12_07830 [Sulfolobus islandicus]
MTRYIIDTRVLEYFSHKIIERRINEIVEGEIIVVISKVDPARILARLKLKKGIDIIVSKNKKENWILYLIKSSYH